MADAFPYKDSAMNDIANNILVAIRLLYGWVNSKRKCGADSFVSKKVVE